MSPADHDEQTPRGRPRRSRSPRPTVRRPGSLSGPSAQRARVLAAVRELAHEQGYAGVSISTLLARARVSSKTFYEHFETSEACFAAAFDEAIVEMRAAVMPIYREPGQWLDRVRRALHAMLERLDRDPALATLLFLEAQKAGPEVQERRARVHELLMLILDGGRSTAALAPPPLTDEVLVGGAIGVIRARLSRPAHPPLVSVTSELMAVIAHCYLGADAALAEVRHPAIPPARPHASGTQPVPAPSSPPIRLTYRTLRVIRAVAENPGASNRDVALAAGIADQGQVSRLLGRLRSSGLIANDADDSLGKPNAWRLTLEGEELARAAHADFRIEG